MSTVTDTVVIGDGIIGLCAATAIAKRGLRVMLVGEQRPGQASRAAAGMLAPSVERANGPAHTYAVAARNFYPEYLEELADSTGIRVPINRLGVLQVALTDRGVRGLLKTMSPEAQFLQRKELTDMEPSLGHALGAVLNPDDGAVDNVILMSALAELVEKTPSISTMKSSAVSIGVNGEGMAVELASGTVLECAWVVVAPGAWGSAIDGAAALAAVSPSRGQLVSFPSLGLRHVTYGPRGYLVPRASGTLVAGSTMENVGFDAGISKEGVARVRSAAEEISPGLAGAPMTSAWAGLRPVTPDMLPIIGPDENNPRVVYACGHSRNGILMGPLTGETVASLVTGEAVEHDLSQFRPGRF